MDTLKSYTTCGGEEKIQKVLTDLEFISSLKPGEKFNPITKQIRDSTYMSVIARTINTDENKMASYEFIKIALDSAVELLYAYSDSKESLYKRLVREIYDAIKKSQKGITSQIETYGDCREFRAKLLTLIRTINVKIDDKLGIESKKYTTNV